MNKIFESEINIRRETDENMYNKALDDLMSVLGVKTGGDADEIKGAIVQILHYLKCDIPELPSDVTDFDLQLSYMLKPSGTMKRRVELVERWWKHGIGCFLASKKNGEIIAITPGKFGGYEYINKSGIKIKINKETAKDINVDAFCFYRGFEMKPLKIKNLIVFMSRIISRMDWVFILAMMIVGPILGLISTKITKIIYGIVIPSGTPSLIAPIAGVTLSITITTWLIGITKSLINQRIEGKLSISINSAVMMRMFSLPPSFFRNYSSGDLSGRIGYLSSFCKTIADTLLSTIIPALFSFVYVPQMFDQAPSLVLPGMAMVISTIIFSVAMTFLRQKLMEEQIKISPKLQSTVFSIFGGMQKIKISGSEKRAFSKWAKHYSELSKINFSPPWYIKISGAIGIVISTLGTIALYYVASKNKVPVENYFAFTQAYGAVSAAIFALNSVALQAANLKPIMDLIKPLMETAPENDSKGKIITSLSGEIEVNNVTFRYAKDSPYILKDLTLKIRKGEYVAIVGKTGCGKSTLMRLLLGFEKPESGAIYYDGENINDINVETLRQKIGVVMQNGSIFPGDIFSNIIITAPWKTIDDAWKAAKLAGIDSEIRNMPMGMNTLISEGTGGISGGQKQRLMIARAIIGKPSILFLDEATSALDNITQSYVANSLSGINATRLVIAHRLSTIKNCDRIIVLSDGRCVEEGKFDELMLKRGEFYDLAIRQVINARTGVI